MKRLNLKKEFEKILQKKKYYLKYNRNKKISYRNYYSEPIDPDGKKRNLFKEEKYKLSQLKIVIDFLKKISSKKKNILDFGCGFGWLLKNLNSKNWNKFGLEINQIAKTFAQKNKIQVFEKLNLLGKQKFDVITMIHIIEHLRNPIDDLKEIKKKIKSNGYLIVETPDFDCAMARKYNTKFRLLHDKTHISLFSSESLVRLLCDLKFKDID